MYSCILNNHGTIVKAAHICNKVSDTYLKHIKKKPTANQKETQKPNGKVSKFT
jgi:hypothetical protein